MRSALRLASDGGPRALDLAPKLGALEALAPRALDVEPARILDLAYGAGTRDPASR